MELTLALQHLPSCRQPLLTIMFVGSCVHQFSQLLVFGVSQYLQREVGPQNLNIPMGLPQRKLLSV